MLLDFRRACTMGMVGVLLFASMPATPVGAQAPNLSDLITKEVAAAIPSLPGYGSSDFAKGSPLCTSASQSSCRDPLKGQYSVSDAAAKGAVPGPDGSRSFTVYWAMDPQYTPRSSDQIQSDWQSGKSSQPCGRGEQDDASGCKGSEAQPGAIDISSSGDPYSSSARVYSTRPCGNVWTQVAMYLSTVASHGARNKPDVISGMKSAAESQVATVASVVNAAVDKACGEAGGTTPPTTNATPTPTGGDQPNPQYQLSAFLDCGNVVAVQVGTSGGPGVSGNPGPGTPCDLVIDGFRTDTTNPIVVTATNAAGAPADFSLGGLVPGTGIVVSPGDFQQDPTNLDKPWNASLEFYACPQTNSCGDARAGEPVITPADPTPIRLHVTQDGAGEAWVDVTMKPVGLGSSTRVDGCALGRSVALAFVSRDTSDNVEFQATFQSNITTAISYLRLELADSSGNPFPTGGYTPWQSVPDPLNPGTADPRSAQNLLHVFDPNTGQELTNPVGQVGFVGPVGVPASVPTTYTLVVADPDRLLADPQMALLTAYIGDPFTLSCQVSGTTPLPVTAGATTPPIAAGVSTSDDSASALLTPPPYVPPDLSGGSCSAPDASADDGAGAPGSGAATMVAASFAQQSVPSAQQVQLASSLIDKVLTTATGAPIADPSLQADDADVSVVAQELARFPVSILQLLQQQGTRVKVTRGNITTYLTQLRGQHPRNWPAGTTWDNANGVGLQGLGQNPINPREVVLATQAGQDGQRELGPTAEVLHEVGHNIDRRAQSDLRKDRSATDPNFRAARDRDLEFISNNPNVQRCIGEVVFNYIVPNTPPEEGGYEELYGFSLDSYYHRDLNGDFLRTNLPNLYAYWDGNPLGR